MKLYGVWCQDEKNGKGDWLRELRSNVDDGGIAILTFTSKREAFTRAAKHYGFDTYREAKNNGWVEVKQIA